MRPIAWSFLGGLNAIVVVSIVDYILLPNGDTHLGASIYVVLAAAYFVCLLVGTAVAKLFVTLLQELGPSRVLLFLSFLGIVFGNTGVFSLIYYAILRGWPWERVMGIAAPLVVGFAAAGAFVYAYKAHSA